MRAAPAVLLLALAAGGCGGAARQAGPTGHIEAGATFAQGGPEQLAFDRAGNLYGVDCQDSWIFRADTQGRLWIVGGTGGQGFTGNGGTAAQAQFTCPSGIAVDATGNVYVSDHDNRVRRIDPRGVVHAFAGAGAIPPLDSNGGAFAGDGGPARQARFRAPAALAIDRRGNLFVADRGNGAVRRIRVNDTITTVARVDEPAGLAFDAAGTLYVATPSDVRRVGRHGVSTTYARLKHRRLRGRRRPGGEGRARPAGCARLRLERQPLHRRSRQRCDSQGRPDGRDHNFLRRPYHLGST